MDIEGLWLLEELQNPLDHAFLDEEIDCIFFDTHFLEDGDAESLSHTSIFLFFQNFNYFIRDGQINLNQIFNSFDCTSNNTDESTDSVLESVGVDA